MCPPHGERMTVRVLVVDDSAAFRRAAVELLTLRGFAVLRSVPDRAAALDIVAAGGCPDGALVDVHLAGDNGLDVTAALRSLCGSVRVVLTSSEVDGVADADLARCGAVAFVAKDELVMADLDALLRAGLGEQEARLR
jgi:CheY-like chemotaxis protein